MPWVKIRVHGHSSHLKQCQLIVQTFCMKTEIPDILIDKV